jgi:hypothetical protein
MLYWVAKRRGSPPEIVCVLVVDIILDKFEVEHLALTSPTKEPCLPRTGDLVPTCQPVQIAELAKSETYNDRN